MNADEETLLLGELENLVEKQIELARRGGIAAVERLMREGDWLVEKIKSAGLLEKPEFESRRQRLNNLYRQLQLAISSQKGVVDGQLKSVRKGKRTLSAYRGSI
jgi:hypothetical protein